MIRSALVVDAGFRIKRTPQQRTISVQDLKPYKTMPLEMINEGMDWDRLTVLRQEVAEVVGKLWRIQAEVEMKLGETDYRRQLLGFVNDLKKYNDQKLEDALHYHLGSRAGRK